MAQVDYSWTAELRIGNAALTEGLEKLDGTDAFPFKLISESFLDEAWASSLAIPSGNGISERKFPLTPQIVRNVYDLLSSPANLDENDLRMLGELEFLGKNKAGFLECVTNYADLNLAKDISDYNEIDDICMDVCTAIAKSNQVSHVGFFHRITEACQDKKIRSSELPDSANFNWAKVAITLFSDLLKLLPLARLGKELHALAIGLSKGVLKEGATTALDAYQSSDATDDQYKDFTRKSFLKNILSFYRHREDAVSVPIYEAGYARTFLEALLSGHKQLVAKFEEFEFSDDHRDRVLRLALGIAALSHSPRSNLTKFDSKYTAVAHLINSVCLQASTLSPEILTLDRKIGSSPVDGMSERRFHLNGLSHPMSYRSKQISFQRDEEHQMLDDAISLINLSIKKHSNSNQLLWIIDTGHLEDHPLKNFAIDNQNFLNTSFVSVANHFQDGLFVVANEAFRLARSFFPIMTDAEVLAMMKFGYVRLDSLGKDLICQTCELGPFAIVRDWRTSVIHYDLEYSKSQDAKIDQTALDYSHLRGKADYLQFDRKPRVGTLSKGDTESTDQFAEALTKRIQGLSGKPLPQSKRTQTAFSDFRFSDPKTTDSDLDRFDLPLSSEVGRDIRQFLLNADAEFDARKTKKIFRVLRRMPL